MQKPLFNPEEKIVFFEDVKQLYMSIWRRLLKWAFVGAALSFLYFGSSRPQYKAEAIFKEGAERSDGDGALKEFMGGAFASSHQPQAVSLMKSQQVLRPLVEKMGLQVFLRDTRWKIPKAVRRFREVLRAEQGQPLTDIDSFLFQDVCYEGDRSLSLSLYFTDLDHFIVYDTDQTTELQRGTLGIPVHIADARFTVKATPQKFKVGVLYSFDIVHWASVTTALRNQIKMKSDAENNALIHISLCHRDRHLAARLLNELMASYQFYLKREYDHAAKQQLVYLEGKQEQVLHKMDELFDQHAAYLKKNLAEEGCVGLEQESRELLGPYQNMHNRLLSIEIELACLDWAEKEGDRLFILEGSVFAKGFGEIFNHIQTLQQQKDYLELALCQTGHHDLEARKKELKEVRSQRFAVEQLMQEVDLGKQVSSFDWDPGLCYWATAIQDSDEREDFSEYLESYARLLSIREKVLQEGVFYNYSPLPELEGIDLSSARALFVEYNARLDQAEALMRRYAGFKEQILRPDFDLASLNSVLEDPLCQKIIEEIYQLTLQIRDEKHHSSKEGLRWEETIALHRKTLANHLEQLYKVEELNVELVRNKMVGLQKISLDCINQQISVLHEQMKDAIKQQKCALLAEREILEKKMASIRSVLMEALPEKWRFEKWLTLKTGMVEKMMETITQIVESKTISTHLHHVGSKPLDCALLPLIPIKPQLYRMTYLGAFLLPLLVFCFHLLCRIWGGFPTSFEKLKALRLPVLGPVSPFCDGPAVELVSGPDLELLRQLALFTEGNQVIALIAGRGPDYSYAFCENLARMSAKSIVLRCDFLSKFRKENGPGLLQIWKGEIGELPIRQGKGFDYIPSGGYSPFGTEIIQSPSFGQLLNLFKKNYDKIFLVLRAPLSSAESVAALRLCEKAIVTVSGEQTEELTPFMNWAYDENRCRLTFITRS